MKQSHLRPMLAAALSLLLHFSRWQQKQLKQYSVQNINDMAAKHPTTHRAMKRAADFFYAAMNAYWSGDLANQRDALKAMPGYEPFSGSPRVTPMNGGSGI